MAEKPKTRGFKRSAAKDMIDTMSNAEDGKPSTTRGLMEGDTRFTTVIKRSDLAILKDWAYTERITMKALVADMVKTYIDEKVDMGKLITRPDGRE